MMYAGLSILAVLTASPVAVAQVAPSEPPTAMPGSSDAVRIAAAEDLLDTLHLEQQYDGIFDRMLPVMSLQVFNGLKTNMTLPQKVRTFFADPANVARGERIFAVKLSQAFKRRYPMLREATAKAYAAALTLDDLRGLTAFYRGPLGQKALTVLPQLQNQLMPIGMAAGAEAGKEAMVATLREVDLDSDVPAA